MGGIREAQYNAVVAALRQAAGARIVPDDDALAAVCASFPELPRVVVEGISARVSQTTARRRVWRFEGQKRWAPAALLAEFERRWAADARATHLAEMADELCCGVPPCHVARIVLRAFLASQRERPSTVVRVDFDDETESDHVCPRFGRMDGGTLSAKGARPGEGVSGDNGACIGESAFTDKNAKFPFEEERPKRDGAETEGRAFKRGDARSEPSSFQRLYRDPALIRHAGLQANVRHCQDTDPVFSPALDTLRTSVGRRWEDVLLETLRRLDIPHMDEADMRRAGYARTPDAVLREPIAVRVPVCAPGALLVGGGPRALTADALCGGVGRLHLGGDASFVPDGRPAEATVVVKWIESKAWFGDPPSHATYLRDQYWPYYNRFGPGLVLYWFGFVAEPAAVGMHETRGIAVADAFPPDAAITRIQSPLCAELVAALPPAVLAALRSSHATPAPACSDDDGRPGEDSVHIGAVCDALVSATSDDSQTLPHSSRRRARNTGV